MSSEPRAAPLPAVPGRPANDDRDPALEASEFALKVNFELHRRKAFWVDESLAFMLARTDIDADGSALRVPFPAFALVYTDRHVLSLAERLLYRRPMKRIQATS